MKPGRPIPMFLDAHPKMAHGFAYKGLYMPGKALYRLRQASIEINTTFWAEYFTPVISAYTVRSALPAGRWRVECVLATP